MAKSAKERLNKKFKIRREPCMEAGGRRKTESESEQRKL